MHFFANESESLSLGGLTIENRLDRVSFYGSVDLTLDAQGLALALSLQTLIGGVVEAMKAKGSALPARVVVKEPVSVGNLFGLPDPEPGR